MANGQWLTAENGDCHEPKGSRNDGIIETNQQKNFEHLKL